MNKMTLGVALTMGVLLVAGAVPARADFLVNPTNLTISVAPGQNPASPQLVFVQTTGANTTFTLTSKSSGWLSVGNPSSTSTPANFTVNAFSAGFGQGVYPGSITVTDTTGANAPVVISVTLVVSTGPVIVASPSSLTFTQTQVGVIPSPQTITVSNPVPTALSFTATASDPWLSVSPASGSAISGTPATLTVSVNPGPLVVGAYSGTITIASTNAANSPVTIAVSLSVPSGPILAAGAASLNFSATAGGPDPQAQTLLVGNSGPGTLSFSAAASTNGGGAWLSVTPAQGSAPPSSSVSVAAKLGSLAAGTYTGQVVLTAFGTAGNSPLTIPVTMTVIQEPTISLGPATLTFTAAAGASNPPAQNLTLANSGGGILSYTLTATTTSGGPWLSVAYAGSLTLSGSSSVNWPVNVNLAGLAAGTYTGKITVASGLATNSPQSLTVNLTVTQGTAAALSVSPSSLVFEAIPGGPAPNPQTISVSTSTSGVNFTATAATSSGGNWLSVTPSGTTPGTATVTANSSGLAAGSYSGTVTVSAGSAIPQTVAVVLNVVSGSVILVTPSTLTFASSVGTNPAPQTLAFSVFGGGSLSYSYTTTVNTSGGGSWLSVTPSSGSGPTTLTVSANVAGLSAGTYIGLISITSAGTTNNPFSVGVQLTLNNLPALVLGSSTVQLTNVSPGVLTANVPLTTTGTGTANFNLASTTTSGGGWLSATSSSTTTPASITVTANPAGLAAGSYRGAVTVSSSGASNGPLTINVEFAVSAPQFSPAGVVGGAFYNSSSDSAGGILSLFGTGFASSQVNAGSLPLPTSLGGIQVQVNGVPAPLFFVSSTQINFAMPWEVLGQSQVQITVLSGTVASLSETVSVAPVGPGIFSTDSSGKGQGAIQIANVSPPTFAAPTGSIPGSATRPVVKGEYLTIYCAGLGDVTPRPATGTAAAGLSTTVQKVTVTLGGSVVPATQFDFAGLAPGFVGLYQVNVQVPTSAPSGSAVPLFLTVGGVQSNTVTIAIQ
jgi:uncharacterized protein (TIGR03437 family)